MNTHLSLSTLICFMSIFCSVSIAHGATEIGSLRVLNLAENQKITEGVPALFRINSSADVNKIEIFSNGEKLGHAERAGGALETTFRFHHTFYKTGEQDISFEAYGSSAASPLSRQTVRIDIVPQNAPAPSRSFNSYILKAVAHLTKHWGLMGYDITKQLTHPIDYNKKGTLIPTGGGLTMCVSGMLETIITAFEIYSKEMGHTKIYDFLPFASWNTLHETNIKAHIWVNAKLNSYGTADALRKFGMGENVEFKDLEPGSFINLNRTTRTGHSVVFLSFIDIKGQDLATHSDKVAGFRYFGAQGKKKKGKGGFSYRHAFFSEHGCPDVPYERDCDVIYSDSQKMLTSGMMWDPADWKNTARSKKALMEGESLTEIEKAYFSPATEFDGITTDD